MSRLTINIEQVEGGYRAIASNGDLPFEGKLFATESETRAALRAAYAYDNSPWDYIGLNNGCSIKID